MHIKLVARACGALLLLVIGAVGTVTSLGGGSPAGAADGVTLCHDAALARQRTEVDADMTVPQFDPALGTLLEVSVPAQNAHLDTDARFENLAQTAVQFEEDMTYELVFTSPGGLASPPAITGTIERVPLRTFPAFDGTLDFAGASAYTQPSTARDEAAAPVSATDPATLGAFTGAGRVAFHVATQISEAFTGGGGNVNAEINTFIAAAVTVCYRYQPLPPPPPPPPPPTTAPPADRRGEAAPVPAPVPAAPRFTG